MRQPKKSKKADMRRYSFIFFLIGLNITVWSAFYALDLKTIYFNDSDATGTEEVLVVNGKNGEVSDDEFKVKIINPEEIENLVNTIAYTHAVWPGYKGDITDGRKVRKHFSKNLAKVIINSGGVETYSTNKVHFYYVVRKDGAIQFLAIVEGGKTTKGIPVKYIKHVQKTMSIGIPGIQAGTDEKGESITVVYELVIIFTPKN